MEQSVQNEKKFVFYNMLTTLFHPIKIVYVVLCIASVSGCAQKKSITHLNENLQVSQKIIYENNFDTSLTDWKVEQVEGGNVEVKDGKLEIIDESGCTIWLTRKLDGPIKIVYDAFIIENGGPQDRVSDMNCFWMAKDLRNPDNIFANSEERGGKFSNYDTLRLYYMGVGGNDNTTTRFRRYVGNGERPLLPEYDLVDSKYMLTSNKIYRIKIIANRNHIQFYRNDVLIIDFFDKQPYTSGYFGFRTVNNHMTIDNFKVYQLTDKE